MCRKMEFHILLIMRVWLGEEIGLWFNLNCAGWFWLFVVDLVTSDYG